MTPPLDLALIPDDLPLDAFPGSLRTTLASIKVVAMDVDGVVTDGGRWYGRAGHVALRFDSRDGLGIDLLHRAGVQVMWLSAVRNEIVEARARDLGVEHVHLGVEDKPAVFQSESDSHVAFIGDDIWDWSVLRIADVAIAVRDAHPSARNAADVITRNTGGHGAVREVADLILVMKGLDPLVLLGIAGTRR